MEPTRRICTAVAIFALLLKVCADPECQKFPENEVVCTAGQDDHILRKGLVSDFADATKIILKNCRITDLEGNAFENVFYLQYIDLSENKINTLQAGVLDGNIHVTYLNLSNNVLTTLPTGLFNQKPNIEILDLKGNRLNSLPADVFVALRKLSHLDLSYNDFVGKDVSPYIFSKPRKIKFLDFSRNDMSASPENLLNALQELDVLNLDRCSLKDVPQFATKANLRTMRHLTLSANLITKIDQPRTFMALENLETLNLAGNLIDNVAANAFIYLKNIKVINLKENKLKILPDGFFRNLGKLASVDLSRNKLEIIPLNAFRGTVIQELDLSENRFTYLDVYFCSQLRNAGIRISKFYFNDNPWQCACLNDIIKEMKSFGIEYNGKKYDGRHPVCVTTKKFSCKRELVDNNLFLEMYDQAMKGPTST